MLKLQFKKRCDLKDECTFLLVTSAGSTAWQHGPLQQWAEPHRRDEKPLIWCRQNGFKWHKALLLPCVTTRYGRLTCTQKLTRWPA